MLKQGGRGSGATPQMALLAVLVLLSLTVSSTGAQSCSRDKQGIVYIKTHKTGSSTLANLFHRYGYKYKSNLALPIDNTFYAWPNLDKFRILSTIWNHKDSDVYNLFCSAHVRYEPSALSQLVPNPLYITVLRSPATHVRSSWSYWGIPQHIKEKSGRSFTLEQFMQDPKKNIEFGRRGDKMLLVNSQAFDLGLTNTPSESDVEQLIATMDKDFIVLITDLMDESLVLLKRKLCWELEDVVYMSLKQRKKGTKQPSEAEEALNTKIKTMNYADQMLFDHFKAKLLAEIEKEVGFEEELEEYRALRLRMSEDCAQYEHSTDQYKRHRIIEGEASEAEIKCSLLLMDSIEFSKLHKWRLGGEPSKVECGTGGYPVRSLAYIRTLGVPDDTFANSVMRQAHTSRYVTNYIRPQTNYHLVNDLTPEKTFYTRRSLRFHYFISHPKVVTSYQWIQSNMNARPLTVAVLMDPVQRFLRLWNEMGLATKLGVDMEAYLDNPDQYTSLIGYANQRVLHSGMARSIGYTGPLIEGRASASRIGINLSTKVPLLLVLERLLDSLVLLRRAMCVGKNMVLFPVSSSNHNFQNPNQAVSLSSGEAELLMYPKIDVGKELHAKIVAANAVDAVLYERANALLNTKASRETSFEAEKQELKKGLAETTKTCARSDKAHSVEQMCEQMQMNADEFSEYQLQKTSYNFRQR